MSDVLQNSEKSPRQWVAFEDISELVSSVFQVEEEALEFNIPTFYLKQPQETKEAFLRLLDKLKPLNLIAFLRKENGRIFLKVVSSPSVKKSNLWVNWLLFLGTVTTTFITGFLMASDLVDPVNLQVLLDPVVGGLTFMVAIMAVLGLHEFGHKLTANKKKIDATLPYFIPGLPPLGTFGAVIMQKSLPPNKDALFDVGANGPIAGFIIATFVSAIGLTLLIPANAPVSAGPLTSIPLLWILLIRLFSGLNLIPAPSPDLLLHPVAWAGWVGLLVTMLNLLPAAMLDGGHVARSLANEKVRLVLSIASILYLIVQGFWPMALLVILMSNYKHPGPLDDVSRLSTTRKFLTIGLVAIFLLCSFPIMW